MERLGPRNILIQRRSVSYVSVRTVYRTRIGDFANLACDRQRFYLDPIDPHQTVHGIKAEYRYDFRTAET